MSLTRCVILQAFACVLIGSSTSNADGFFRRLPEVGEYAIYDTVVVVVVSNVGDIAQEIPEYTGTLTLQCVGKTTIDETEHYWIEIIIDLENSMQPFDTTWKLLVSEADLIDGDPIANFSRGWQRFSGLDPAPLTADSLMDSTSPTPLFLRAILWGIEGEAETLNQAQTVLINGNEVHIEAAERGDFAPVELSSTPDIAEALTGWGTWWLHEEAAFGVAAAEQLWTVEVADAGPIEYAIQCSLKETGTDAVSALPDSE